MWFSAMTASAWLIQLSRSPVALVVGAAVAAVAGTVAAVDGDVAPEGDVPWVAPVPLPYVLWACQVLLPEDPVQVWAVGELPLQERVDVWSAVAGVAEAVVVVLWVAVVVGAAVVGGAVVRAWAVRAGAPVAGAVVAGAVCEEWAAVCVWLVLRWVGRAECLAWEPVRCAGMAPVVRWAAAVAGVDVCVLQAVGSS
ncbi:hypothetical protein GCM10009663_62530 [Kitasatospora arboriphila]|uniref:Uncharacterized protein n=1 Tax=Kitasatospora arboriphila TaxID=258052 RepID=A0ABP4EN50_9ACTN